MQRCPTDYDEYASTYAWTRQAVPWVVAPLSRVLAKLDPGSTALEIGCGTGNYARALADGRRDVSFVAFDLSRPMLREAAARRPRVAFVAGDAARAFPFKDHAFGLAFAVDVVHHIHDLASFFSEAARVLRPQGHLLLVTDSEETLRQRSLTAFFPETLSIELQRYPSTASLRRHAADAALRLLQAERAEGRIPLSNAFLRSLDARCSSALRLLAPSDHERGMARLRAAQARGEEWHSCYVVLHYGLSAAAAP
jgi:SAM-dependent methyltransferase